MEIFIFQKSSAIKSLWLALCALTSRSQRFHLCREVHPVPPEEDVQVLRCRKAQRDIKANLIQLQEITVISPDISKTGK